MFSYTDNDPAVSVDVRVVVRVIHITRKQGLNLKYGLHSTLSNMR